MKKRYIILMLFSFIASSLFSSSYSGHQLSDAKAEADVILSYKKDFARIGFTDNEVSAFDFAAKREIAETVLIADADSDDAYTETNIWCFWQINNSDSYDVKIAASDSSGRLSWKITGSDSEVIITNAEIDRSSAVIESKTGSDSISGSKLIKIVISDYRKLPAGRYVLPITLTLESRS